MSQDEQLKKMIDDGGTTKKGSLDHIRDMVPKDPPRDPAPQDDQKKK